MGFTRTGALMMSGSMILCRFGVWLYPEMGWLKKAWAITSAVNKPSIRGFHR